jgi:hypothetical protein
MNAVLEEYVRPRRSPLPLQHEGTKDAKPHLHSKNNKWGSAFVFLRVLRAFVLNDHRHPNPHRSSFSPLRAIPLSEEARRYSRASSRSRAG